MKIIRKYATITLLLFSIAAIVPAYGNLKDEYIILKERLIQQSKRPDVLKKVFLAGESAFLTLGIIAVIGYSSIGVRLVYREWTGGKYQVYKIQAQRP